MAHDAPHLPRERNVTDTDPTERRPRTKRRGGLFVTDAELIERLGVPVKVARETIRMLDRNPRSGFPRKKAIWGDRRYWPAIEEWLEKSTMDMLGGGTSELPRRTRHG